MRIGLCLLIIASLTLAPDPSSAQDGFDLSLMWEFVRGNPEKASITCYPIEAPAGSVFYNESAVFPLASVTKLFIFLEFAERVENGDLNSSTYVDVADVNRYDLDRTDGGAHDRFLETLPDGTRYVTLWEVASLGMMQYSSNAASDFLLDYLEPVNWFSLYDALNLRVTSYPHALAEIALMMSNHETGEAQREDVNNLSILSGRAWFDRFLNDAQWREDELAYRDRPGRSFPDWEVQTAILDQHTAIGTALDLMRVMQAIYIAEDSPLSQNVRQMTRTALQWTGDNYINNTYIEYGSKLGYYSGGLLALVAYGDPLEGGPVLSVTLLRDVPRRTYYDMRRADTIGDFAHWLNLNGCQGLRERLPSPL